MSDVHDKLKDNHKSRNTHPKKMSKEEREAVTNASEVLNSLEHEHRGDLPLHLYSSFLLKKLLYKANDKKYPYEVDQFVRTQIKDNWVSWPNNHTILDPQTNKIYEDILEDDNNTHIAVGEVSGDALSHASDMLKLELNAQWQNSLAKSAKLSNTNLDIDNCNIPNIVTNSVIEKIDRLFLGLHHKVAKRNKISVSQNATSSQVNISQEDTEAVIKPNKKIKLTYHDIIEGATEMNEDMKEIYMKSLELFGDIPEKFQKGKFRLPKKVLKKYRISKSEKKSNVKRIFASLNENYIPMDKLLKDERLTAEEKKDIRVINKKLKERALNRKTLLQVKGIDQDESESDEENKDLPYSQSRWKNTESLTFYLEDMENINDNEYNIKDCITELPRN